MRNNEDDQAQQMMADNFIESCEGKEVEFTSHPVASKALELLAAHSSPDVFEKFTTAIMPSLRLLVNDSCASFVLESCLKVAMLRALFVKTEQSDEQEEEPSSKKKKYSKVSSSIEYNMNLDIKPAHKDYCQQLVEKLSRFLLNNLEDYLNENNANHLLRSCLLSLSGVLSQKNHFQKVEMTNLKTKHGVVVPESWSEIAADFATRLMSWPQFPDLAFVESSSVVLQTLCQAMKNLDTQQETLKKLIKAIMRKSFKDETETDDPEDFKAFSSPASLHLLESMMDSCDEKLLNKMYKKYFKTKFIELSQSPNLNFAVQRLIDAMADKETFEEIFNRIHKTIPNRTHRSRFLVVQSLRATGSEAGSIHSEPSEVARMWSRENQQMYSSHRRFDAAEYFRRQKRSRSFSPRIINSPTHFPIQQTDQNCSEFVGHEAARHRQHLLRSKRIANR